MALVTIELDVNEKQDDILYKINAEEDELPFAKQLLWLANGMVYISAQQSMLLAKIGKNIMEGKEPTYGFVPDAPDTKGTPVILEEVGGPVLVNE